MPTEEQKSEFDRLVSRAKKAGVLKALYPERGIAILQVPDQTEEAKTQPSDSVAQIPESNVNNAG